MEDFFLAAAALELAETCEKVVVVNSSPGGRWVADIVPQTRFEHVPPARAQKVYFVHDIYKQQHILPVRSAHTA